MSRTSTSLLDLMMKKLVLLLILTEIISAAPRPASPRVIQAVSGENAAVWCRFNRPENFTPKALDWKVNDTKVVIISRNKGWIDRDTADAQYALRTSVSLEDLARGILLVNISNVTPSDSGNYEGVVIGKLAGHEDPLELKCSVELIVAPKDEQTRNKRNDSRTSPGPPAEGDPGQDAAEKRNDGLKIVLPCFLILAAVALTIMLVVAWKRGVIPADVWKTVLPCVLIPFAVVTAVVWILVKRGVIPIRKKEGEPKTSEGDQQSAAEEGLVGSKVTDSNNQPSDTVY